MRFHEDHRPAPDAALLGTALSVAPVAVGCAVGLLLADRIKGKARHRFASGLFAIGALATGPLVIDYLSRSLDHPAFRRGRQRRLESIRDSGTFPDAELLGGDASFTRRDHA